MALTASCATQAMSVQILKLRQFSAKNVATPHVFRSESVAPQHRPDAA
jgi:hypothetical protein